MKSNIEELPPSQVEEYLESFMKDYRNSFGLYLGNVVFKGAHATVVKAFVEHMVMDTKIANPSANVMLVFGRWAMEERLSTLEEQKAKKEIFE